MINMQREEFAFATRGAMAGNQRSINLHQRLGYTITPDPLDDRFVVAVLVNKFDLGAS